MSSSHGYFNYDEELDLEEWDSIKEREKALRKAKQGRNNGGG